ncbi:MAG: family 43 glycosylhydrolase [Firmicutes bacterium]|nr:family 43 glycosylhydrolase [Bacillota bacterium]NLL88800.1 family 43 glycosylhydrolase [Bacillota bacterium]
MDNSLNDAAKKYFTPYKLGRPVLTGSGRAGDFDALAVDCPFVFYHNSRFYMLYVGFDGFGYQTGLAVSGDLVNWERKGPILRREEHVGWDRVGAAGTWILKNTNSIWELPALQKVGGRYWMVYHSYPEAGYEAGPAQIGLAWSEDPELMQWHRLPEPVFSWKDGADWENGGLYKACLLWENDRYYLFYNAKNAKPRGWVEQIGVAVSTDLNNWQRYEGNPIVRVSEGRWDSQFCADPYVVKDKGRWLMFYYGFNRKHAQDGLAFSRNLYDWTKLPEPILANGKEGEIDHSFAHKPSILYHNGTLYHFYCACRKYREGDPAKSLWDEFRTITFAASRPIK